MREVSEVCVRLACWIHGVVTSARVLLAHVSAALRGDAAQGGLRKKEAAERETPAAAMAPVTGSVRRLCFEFNAVQESVYGPNLTPAS